MCYMWEMTKSQKAAKWSKVKWNTVKEMDRLYSRRPQNSRCIEIWKTTWRWRMTLSDVAEDREQWKELVAASVAERSCTMKMIWPDLILRALLRPGRIWLSTASARRLMIYDRRRSFLTTRCSVITRTPTFISITLLMYAISCQNFHEYSWDNVCVKFT